MIRPHTNRLIIYFTFLVGNMYIFIYNTMNKTQWAYDIVFSVTIVTAILLMSKRLKITPEGFLLVNIGFLLHSLGSFGFYSLEWGIIGYDNIVHFFSSTAAAYVSFNFIARKLHIRRNQKVEETVVDEHKVILIMLVIALVAMFGVIVEVIEFSGFLYLGEGEGIFFVGPGDSNRGGDSIQGQYIDTMSDIVVNTMGSILGVVLFYFFRYRHKYWIKY